MVTRKKAPAKKAPAKKAPAKTTRSKSKVDPFAAMQKKFQGQFDRDTKRNTSSGSGAFVDKPKAEWFSPDKGDTRITLRLVPDLANGLLFLPVKVHTFKTDQIRSWMDFDWLIGRNREGIDDEIIALKEHIAKSGRLTAAMISAWNETSDPAQEIARAQKKSGVKDGIIWSRTRFLWNVYDKRDKTIKVYESSKIFKDTVESLMSAAPDLAHPVSGRNLEINISMNGKQRVYSPPMLAKRKTSIKMGIAELTEQTYNLFDIAMGYKYCDFKYKIDRTFNALGNQAEEMGITADLFFDSLKKFETDDNTDGPF